MTTTPKQRRNAGAKARAWIAALGLACGFVAAPVGAQTIGNGTLLVASPALTDVNFAHAVVLVLQHDENGTVGVVLNRPTSLVPGTVFPELAEGLGSYAGRLFRGGPVAPTRLLYLVRGLAAATVSGPEVLDKVFLSIDDASLPDMVRLADGTNELRLYAGHATWAPGQLQAEIGAGGWQVLVATPDLVFDEDPSDLWQKLEGRGSNGNDVVADRQGWRECRECRSNFAADGHGWPACRKCRSNFAARVGAD